MTTQPDTPEAASVPIRETARRIGSRRIGLAGRSMAKGSAQYRERYAEPESSLAALLPDSFDLAMVVPVCAESAAFVDGYGAAARSAGRVLVIAVVNGRTGADGSVHARNMECVRKLSARFSLRKLGPGGWLGDDANMTLLVIDRYTPTRLLPAKQGVGLARKIGADVALELIARGRVRHPFFAMTDADTRLPEDYFTRIVELEPDCSAALFPFWHEPSGRDDVDRATALYEIRLRYLQRGLQWASSPYAFHSIGSTTVVHALSYAHVRGVPKRQAAEDFYLLNKLGKLRPLVRLRGVPLQIRSRVSSRVPFGTGAETTKLSRGGKLELYHPDCFAAVHEVVHGLRRLSESPSISETSLVARMSPPVRDFLEAHGAARTWQQLREHAPNRVMRLRRLHDWFDGFRTLKLIHHVRDKAAPAMPWQDAIRLAPFMDHVEDDGACLSKARAELLRQEQALSRLVGPSM